jgi:voltage-gated potassium channel
LFIIRKFRRVFNRIIQNSFISTVFIILSIFLSLSFVFYLFESNQDLLVDFWNSLWWGVVTFTTTGYGDLVPKTLMGRLIAVLMMFFGIVMAGYIAGVATSRIVERNSKARRGLMDYSKLTDHMVICGWKDHIKFILLDVVTLSQDFQSDNIVLVSNIDPERVEALREEKELKDLKFVRGDYFSESNLKRANVGKAAKVIVLADTLESKGSSEVDSKTVMTVMTIKNISKDTYVCAELIDQKYEKNLKSVACDEIFLIRDLSRKLLTNTSVIQGMAHIMNAIIDRQDGGVRLATPLIPMAWIGKSFFELRKHYWDNYSKLVLGVLENSGSPRKMKLDALRDAQKTSDVSKLVHNLVKVKEMEPNLPVLLPPDDYVLSKHARAIVLERI